MKRSGRKWSRAMGYLPRSPRTQTWSPASSFASSQPLARHGVPVPGGDFGLVNAVEEVGQAVREEVGGCRRVPGKPALRPNRAGGRQDGKHRHHRDLMWDVIQQKGRDGAGREQRRGLLGRLAGQVRDQLRRPLLLRLPGGASRPRYDGHLSRKQGQRVPWQRVDHGAVEGSQHVHDFRVLLAVA